MQIHQEMLPVSMKRMELEKSPLHLGPGRWSQTEDGHPSVLSALSNIHHRSCHQPPASATARAGKQRNGKNPPTTLPQLSKGAPGKSLGAKQSQPYTAGDNGDKDRGSPCLPAGSVLSLPCKENPSDALHPQGTAQRHRVAATTTTSIHRPPHRDHPALPAPKPAPNPSAQPCPNSSGFLPGSALPR